MKPHAAPVDYVVLDANLQRSEPARFERLLAGFAAGYAATFHGDEAEPSGRWPARIRGEPAPQPVLRIVVAVQRDGPSEELVGGAALEYYRASRCVLCTYLYVLDRPGHRNRGYARSLLAAAADAFADVGPADAVLAEVEWPDALPAALFDEAAVERARTRLRFFERIGARRIRLDYLQPALAPGSRPVAWLRLLRLPPSGPGAGSDDAALRAALDRFLFEFHAALSEETGAALDDGALAAQLAQLASAHPLTAGLGDSGS